MTIKPAVKANRVAYGETLVELIKENPNVVVLDADACKSTGTLCVREQCPENFVQCGIAEQNMHGIAAGLAYQGKIPFAATFSVFTAMRAVEQFRNSAAYVKANVKLCGTHSGLETGGDGGTHMGIEDVSIMRAIPNVVVLAPSTPINTAAMTRAMAAWDGPCYMRVGKDNAPEIYEGNEEFKIGGSYTVREGKDITIMAYGNMVWRAMEAADKLAADGIDARVIDMYSVKPIDEEAIIKAAKETKGILTVEDHNVLGGLGGAVCEIVSEKCPTKVLRMGLQDVFGRSGDPVDLYKMFKLTPEDIYEKAKELL